MFYAIGCASLPEIMVDIERKTGEEDNLLHTSASRRRLKCLLGHRNRPYSDSPLESSNFPKSFLLPRRQRPGLRLFLPSRRFHPCKAASKPDSHREDSLEGVEASASDSVREESWANRSN
ncbi:hypothetical protein BHE74_00030285 [Ensete ventricosum]|nr:hypothetical protein BHE74_00030285 [Ensete ventricosum]